METLSKAGFTAYYAGGWVRDFLLGHPSDDIDIATNAPPETVQALFDKTVPIGLSFGIILVVLDGHQYEVATFRRDFDYSDGRRPQRVEFSGAVEDAKRRDYTINGMFYDPIREQILDYVGGQEDLKLGLIRAIGNPHERIREDRLRMIRGIRLACRFNFHLDPATADAIRAHASELLPAVAIERVWQELEKSRPFLPQMLLRLYEFGLLQAIFPELSAKIDPKPLPEEAPLIASLIALFPHSTFDERMALCKRMKTSNHELEFAAHLTRTEILLQRVLEPIDWAHLYAHPHGWLVLQILQPSQMSEHTQRRAQLNTWVERIQHRNPVVTSAHLIAAGVKPGQQMGLLLREAERIACNHNLEDASAVLTRLGLNGNLLDDRH